MKSNSDITHHNSSIIRLKTSSGGRTSYSNKPKPIGD
jgi:hypothetical protein